MPPQPSAESGRLGQMLIRRRIALDPRYRNRRTFVAERAPKLYRIINDAELGHRSNFEPTTVAALEEAYDLTSGAIQRALSGGDLEPGPAPAPPEPRPSGPVGFRATPEATEGMRPYLAEILIRAEVARDGHPGERLTGRMVFPGSPADAQLWDILAAGGRSDEEIVWAVAAAQWKAADMIAARAKEGDGTASALTALPALSPDPGMRRELQAGHNSARQ